MVVKPLHGLDLETIAYQEVDLLVPNHLTSHPLFALNVVGHFMKECPSKTFINHHPTEDSYRNKFEKIMSHLAFQETKHTQLGLVTETKEKEWADYDSSNHKMKIL